MVPIEEDSIIISNDMPEDLDADNLINGDSSSCNSMGPVIEINKEII